jgi:hypothetical protein
VADDLVSALLVKIEQLERRAEAAKPGPWKRDYHAAFMHNITAADGHSLITGGLMGSPDIAHVLAHDPLAVLRLCRAHRDLIDEWRKRQQMADLLGADEDTRDGGRARDG